MKYLRFLLLSVLALFMSLSVEAKPSCKAEIMIGREVPKALLTKHTLQESLPKGVLKDQLKVDEPEQGVAYVFIAYRPGAIWEDLFNGGSHVVMIVAQFAMSLRSWKAEQFHLAVTDNPDCADGPQRSYLMNEIWDFSEATTAVEKKNRFRALGRVKGNKDFDEVKRILKLKSMLNHPLLCEDPINKVETHKDYNYLFDNCGNFVETAISWLDPEFADQLEVPLAPAMRR
ncbi:hypothetical protein N0V90_011176 [Kalmusia sp. IMI 367209]|nr:hypothetical protein N0V90_011176 [Kalmusia sp. IMI 367209]